MLFRSVVEDTTTLVAGADYLADNVKGWFTRLDADGYPQLWPNVAITVVYQAGYSDIPADIQDAAIQLVKSKYFSRLRDPSVRAEAADGVYNAQYVIGTGPGGPEDMPASVATALDRYRVLVVG